MIWTNAVVNSYRTVAVEVTRPTGMLHIYIMFTSGAHVSPRSPKTQPTGPRTGDAQGIMARAWQGQDNTRSKDSNVHTDLVLDLTAGFNCIEKFYNTT